MKFHQRIYLLLAMLGSASVATAQSPHEQATLGVTLPVTPPAETTTLDRHDPLADIAPRIELVPLPESATSARPLPETVVLPVTTPLSSATALWDQYVMRVSADAIRFAMPRRLERTSDVHDYLLGTRVVGKALLTADGHIELVPTSDAACFEVVYRGQTVAKTDGFNGPAKIVSTTVTQFTLRKQITLNDAGATSLPSVVTAQTHSTIQHVGSRRGGRLSRLVGRLAMPRVYRDLPEADRITNERTSRQIAEIWDAEVAQELAAINRSLVVRRWVLRGTGNEPLALHFSTTPNYIQIVAAQTGQIAYHTFEELPSHSASPLELCLFSSDNNHWARSSLESFETAQRVVIAMLSTGGTTAGGLRAIGLAAMDRFDRVPLGVDQEPQWLVVRWHGSLWPQRVRTRMIVRSFDPLAHAQE